MKCLYFVFVKVGLLADNGLMNNRLLTLFVASAVLLTGCGSSRKYDSDFADACEFAEYWCGPCEEVDVYTVDTPAGEVIVHKLRDTEFGFVYTVEETVKEYSTGLYASYNAPDFSYYYLQTFLEHADLDDIISEYSLTVELAELQESATEGLPGFFLPSIDIYTDLSLSEYENDLILETFVDELEDFDVRGDYTRENDNALVFFELHSAPSAEESENGFYYHTDNRIYGYQQ